MQLVRGIFQLANVAPKENDTFTEFQLWTSGPHDFKSDALTSVPARK